MIDLISKGSATLDKGSWIKDCDNDLTCNLQSVIDGCPVKQGNVLGVPLIHVISLKKVIMHIIQINITF